LIYAIFFLSGVSALVFQHIWFREAGLVFGNSVWASSLVLSSFMAGLAIGNGLSAARHLGRWNPLYVYALLEATVALTGVSLVFVLPSLGAGLVPFLARTIGAGASLQALRFSLAFLLLIVPTAAMGMTLPVLVARSPSRELFGVTLGRLYGWNTLGAFFGALAGEAVLYEWVGVRGAAFVAGGLNIAAALMSLSLARMENAFSARPEEPAGGALTGVEIRLLAMAALAGACFLALEVVWTRFMLLFVFGSALTFAIMLAAALAGMALGSLLASRSPTFCAAPQAPPILALLAAIAVTASYVCFADVLRTTVGDGHAGVWARVAALSAVLILPTAAVSGALFTGIGVAVRRRRAATSAASLLTLANTLGATAGALVAGFVLLPVLGMERAFWSIALAYAAAALLFPGFAALLRESRTLLLAAGVGILFTALFPAGLMARTYLPLALKPFLAGANQTRVTGFREGLTETVTYVDTLTEGETLHTRLVTNSFSMSGTLFDGRRYMEAFVYLPVAIHPHVRRALLISYGVGVTARALTETREIENIDVVDISRDIIEMASLAVPPGEPRPLEDPRVFTHIEDGRFFLQTANEKYDLITSEPPPPHLGGVVNLYTRQYFDLMKRRLNPGGIVSYWLPVHSLSSDDSRAISAAFCSVFTDCTLWKGMNLDWILLGTNDLKGPVTLDRFRKQWTAAGPRGLRDIGLERPEQLGALFMAEGLTSPDLTGGPPLDDNYPGRLSRAPPPTLSFDPWKRALMDADADRERFSKSSFVRRAWPEEMREATLPYFAIQSVYDSMMGALLPLGPLPSAREAVDLLRHTSLTVLPAILLGTSGDLRTLVNRVEARDGKNQDKGWLHAQLANRDLAERRYDDAISHLRRAIALDPAAPGTRERLTLALCLGGKAAEAERERRMMVAPPDAEWTRALDDACGAPPPEPRS
jgi:predicted membrane-bound spermidine synthase